MMREGGRRGSLTPWRANPGNARANVDEADLMQLKELADFIQRSGIVDSYGGSALNHEAAKAAKGPGLEGGPLAVWGTGLQVPAVELPPLEDGSLSVSVEQLTSEWWEDHEQRIASIVARQWRAFTKRRRATKHRKRVLLSWGWHAWQGLVTHRHRLMRSAIVWDHRRLFIKHTLCFAAWVECLRHTAELREKYLTILQVRALHLYQQALHSWIEYATANVLKRQRIRRAQDSHKAFLLFNVFSAWIEAIQVIRSAAAYDEIAANHCRSSRCRHTITRWCAYVQLQQQKKAKIAQAGSHFRLAYLRTCVSSWHAFVCDLMVARETVIVLLRNVCAKVGDDILIAIISSWRLEAQTAAKRRTIGRRIQATHDVYSMRRAMLSWLQAVNKSKALEIAMQRLMLAMDRMLMCTSFQTWCCAIGESEAELGYHARRQVVYRLVTMAWKRWASDEARHAAFIEHCRDEIQLNRRRHVLHAWKQLAAAQRARGEAKMEAHIHYAEVLCSRAMAAWRQRVEGWIRKRQLHDEALEYRSKCLKMKSIASLQKRVQLKAIEGRVSLWAAQRIVRGPLQAWRSWAAEKALKESLRRKAVRHRYQHQLRCILLAWNTVLLPEPDRQQLWAAVWNVVALQMLEVAFCIWATEFLDICRAQRAKAAKAAMHWRLQLLSTSLRCWRWRSFRLAKSRLADAAAAKHLHDRSLRNCLVGWTTWAANKARRREEMIARLSSATFLLGSALRSRCLMAWRDLTMCEAMERMKAARAVSTRCRRLVSTAWSAWKVGVVMHRWKLLQSRRAIAFSDERLRGVTLSAWCKGVELAKAKQRSRNVAIRHWCKEMCERAMAAWMAYRHHRQAKKARISEALALYVQRLQREGAAQMVRVSEWRQQHRVHSAMTLQMQEMQKALAIVEPFARRWLRIVRERCLLQRREVPPSHALIPTLHNCVVSVTQRGGRPHAGVDMNAWQAAMYQRQIAPAPLPPLPSWDDHPKLYKQLSSPATLTAPSPTHLDANPCASAEVRARSANASRSAAASLPSWRSTNAMAASAARPIITVQNNLNHSPSHRQRPRPRIPSLLFEDDVGAHAATSPVGEPTDSLMVRKSLSFSALSTPGGGAMQRSGTGTEQARLSHARSVQDHSKHTRRPDAVASSSSEHVPRLAYSPSIAPEEVAAMENAVGEFQALRARARQAFAVATSKGSSNVDQEAMDMFYALQAELDRRKAVIQEVACRINEMKDLQTRLMRF